MLKALLTVTLMAFTVFGASHAQAKICYTGGQSNNFSAELSPETREALGEDMMAERMHYLNTRNPHNFEGFQCKTLKPFQIGLEVISIGLAGASAYSACTVVGAPVAAGIGIAGVVTMVASFGVSHMPCEEDTVSKDDVKQMVRDEVCAELERNGVECSTRTKILD